MGVPSTIAHLRPENNRYQNPLGTEIALFRTSEGSMARMAVSWDTPGASGECQKTNCVPVRGGRDSISLVWKIELFLCSWCNCRGTKRPLHQHPS
jgi:hypothetical protein